MGLSETALHDLWQSIALRINIIIIHQGGGASLGGCCKQLARAPLVQSGRHSVIAHMPDGRLPDKMGITGNNNKRVCMQPGWQVENVRFDVPMHAPAVCPHYPLTHLPDPLSLTFPSTLRLRFTCHAAIFVCVREDLFRRQLLPTQNTDYLHVIVQLQGGKNYVTLHMITAVITLYRGRDC